MKVCYNTNLPFLNNPKDLDLSYKTDLDLWGCFGGKIILSYNQRNTVVKILTRLAHLFGLISHFITINHLISAATNFSNLMTAYQYS